MDTTSKARRDWRVVSVALAGWGGLVMAWLARLDGRSQDDIFIIHRYALNLARGEGFVFNPGERVFGLSEPGVGLLLAGLHRLTGIEIPLLASALFGCALLALATLVLLAAGRHGRWPEALVGGTLLLAWSLVWVSHGAGAPLFLALLAGAALLMDSTPEPDRAPGRARLAAVAGVLAGLAVWVRPDAAAAVAILGLLAWWRAKRLPVAFGVSAALVIALGAGAAWLYFGALLPQTLAAKEAARGAFDPDAGAGAFWRAALNLTKRHLGAAPWLFAGLGTLGAIFSLARRGGLPAALLVPFAAVVAATCSVLGVGLFSWYLIPVLVALVYGFAFGAGSLARGAARGLARLRGRDAPGLRGLVAGVVAAALILPLAIPLVRSSHRWATSFTGFGRLETYREAAEWLRHRAPEGDRLATNEIGVIGYYSDRPLGDLLGLVSPESIPHVARRDLIGALQTQDADWVVARTEGRMRRVVASPWFQAVYEEATRFPTPGGRVWVAVRA